MKVLVIQTASIGDVILAQIVAEKLHSSDANAEIHFLLKKGNETLLHGHPFISKLIVWDKSSGKYRSLLRLIRDIRKEKYELLINCQRFFSSGLLTVFSGALHKRGFRKNPLSLFFTKRFPHNIGDGTHETERNLSLLQGICNTEPVSLRLYPTDEDEDAVRPYLGIEFITISPASLWFTKQWPVEKWAALCKLLPAHCAVYLLGGKSDQQLCGTLAEFISGREVKVLAGRLSLLQTAALMKHAKMNYTNDSAPLHLASAMNAPVTAVFCSTIPGFGFYPLSDISHIAEVAGLDCRPCGLHGHTSCPEKHFRCADIDPDSLLKYLPVL